MNFDELFVSELAPLFQMKAISDIYIYISREDGHGHCLAGTAGTCCLTLPVVDQFHPSFSPAASVGAYGRLIDDTVIDRHLSSLDR